VQRRSHSAVKKRNTAFGKNAAQPEASMRRRTTAHACLRPGRFWPLAVLRHRPGSYGYRNGTAPCQMTKTGLGRRRGNKSVFP